MKKDQPPPMVRKDIHDIMKAIKLLNLSQKQDVIVKINNLKTKPDN